MCVQSVNDGPVTIEIESNADREHKWSTKKCATFMDPVCDIVSIMQFIISSVHTQQKIINWFISLINIRVLWIENIAKSNLVAFLRSFAWKQF